MLRPSRAGLALEFYWTQAQTLVQLTKISLKSYRSHMKPDKRLYLYSPLKEQMPLTEENTKLTLFYLKIELNRHRSHISCEIASAGKYYLILPFGWWYNEHPLSNIGDQKKWEFNDTKCQSHVEDEGVGEMFEWDETIAFDEEAQYVGQYVGRAYMRKDQSSILLEGIPANYYQHKKLFLPETALKLAGRQTSDHAIDLVPGAISPWGPIYPMSAHQLHLLNKYLKKLLQQGKISERKSPAGAPILVVPKPDRSMRLCVDYRQLNKLTIANKYPVPLMSELRDLVAGAKIFTKWDLQHGYHLLRIKEGDEWETAFCTRYGHYEYKVMPFGLVNALATFQAMMNTILRNFLDHWIVIYVDDIHSDAENEEEYIALVKKVLAQLEEYDLAVLTTKSLFHVQEVEFLGYIW